MISDTHGRHEALSLPPGDLLIHCGDMFNLGGDSGSIREMDEWFGRQKFKLILCTGGNHDRELQSALAQNPQPFANAHLLSDALIRFQGLSIYGAPWVPDLPGHAFFRSAAALVEHWSTIPASPDILITHTPPKDVLDRSSRGRSHGCGALARELTRVAPRVHCFGHVHASVGQSSIGETLFINASSIESGTGRLRRPATFSLSPRP
ncbi:metallophosphatase domain-containing protein [Sphingomonas sp. ST-64]|uniref:Metallophosphatase domain-containing protein n=1 Tax=Sphingomonas plantiphila TaxID=3163295 RepID=A0ABW8YS73_9SPHN